MTLRFLRYSIQRPSMIFIHLFHCCWYIRYSFIHSLLFDDSFDVIRYHDRYCWHLLFVLIFGIRPTIDTVIVDPIVILFIYSCCCYSFIRTMTWYSRYIPVDTFRFSFPTTSQVHDPIYKFSFWFDPIRFTSRCPICWPYHWSTTLLHFILIFIRWFIVDDLHFIHSDDTLFVISFHSTLMFLFRYSMIPIYDVHSVIRYICWDILHLSTFSFIPLMLSIVVIHSLTIRYYSFSICWWCWYSIDYWYIHSDPFDTFHWYSFYIHHTFIHSFILHHFHSFIVVVVHSRYS